MPDLVVMEVEKCSVSTLPYRETFEGLDKLESLIIRDNDIKSINSTVLSLVTKLKKLDLSGNVIEHMEDYAFSGLSNLRSLALRNNRIKTISDIVFSDLTDVREIHLERNLIQTFNAIAFTQLVFLDRLNLKENECVDKIYLYDDIHTTHALSRDSKEMCHGRNGGNSAVLGKGMLLALASLMLVLSLWKYNEQTY